MANTKIKTNKTELTALRRAQQKYSKNKRQKTHTHIEITKPLKNRIVANAKNKKLTINNYLNNVLDENNEPNLIIEQITTTEESD